MNYSNFKQWLYRGNRPNVIAKVLNRFWAIVHSTGIAPNYFVTLEVPGRKSGRLVSLPLVMVVLDGERYLVSMLGENAQWVLNVRANDGRAVIRSGKREEVLLEDVHTDQRAPILKAYLRRAPGARPHVTVDKDAPLEEFEQIAGEYPVFRVVSASHAA